MGPCSGCSVRGCPWAATCPPSSPPEGPGIGAGGHCIPVDPWFIKEVDPINSRLIQTSRLINDEQPIIIAAKIKQALKDNKNPRILALGVSYKPNTYDTRNSPALKIIDLLRNDGYQIEAYDPLAEGYTYAPIKEIARGTDCIVVLVEHTIIKSELAKEEDKIKSVMHNPLILRFYQD